MNTPLPEASDPQPFLRTVFQWIVRHPLVSMSICIFVLLFVATLSILYPPLREQYAIEQFRAQLPEATVRILYENKGNSLETFFKSLGVPLKLNRIVKLEIYEQSQYNPSKAPPSASFHFLDHCDQLTEINIFWLRASPESWAHISKLKQLKRIRVEYCKVLGNGKLILEDLPLLESFHSHRLQIQQLKLSQLPRLQTLDLKNCGIDDSVFEAAMNVAPTLKSLGIANSQVTDAGLQKLNSTPHLEYLDLRHNRQTSSGYPPFTPQGIIDLKDHPTLKAINLSHTFDQEQLDTINREAPGFIKKRYHPVNQRERNERRK